MTYKSGGNSVTLKMLGFNDIDKTRFSSILTLAERALKKNWTLTTDISADFFMVKESLIPFMDQHEFLKNLPPEQCIFIRRKRDEFERDGLQFYWGENELPSLRLLVELLNRITDDHAKQPSSTPFLSDTLEPDFFDPEQGFLGLLLAQASHPRLYKLIAQQPELVLYVDSLQKCYYSNATLTELSPYFFAEDDELQIENLTEQQLQTTVDSQQLKEQPLKNLLWFTAFTCSLGKVIKGYQKGDIVYLKRWPDLNLPGCRPLIKVAAYMQSNAVDLNTVQANTGMPMDQIYNFYNACKVIDLIGHNQQIDTHNKQLNSEQKQLLARIGKRLNKENQKE